MTALQDIVVVLDDSAASEIRMDIAVALAQQHGAGRPNKRWVEEV